MAFHLAVYDASIANGSALLQVAAISDPIVAPAGNGFLVGVLSKLLRVAAVGTDLTRVQLSSASIRNFAPMDVQPVNDSTVIGTPARYMNFDVDPFPLAVNEELDVFGVHSNAGAQRIGVACWFADGPVRPFLGRVFSVRWTASTTLTANAWSAFSITFDNGIPSGTFAIVGSRMQSAGALWHRWVPRGGPAFRPGGFACQATNTTARANERAGEMGEWLRFTNTTPPQCEVFSRSADTSESGILDLVQVG